MQTEELRQFGIEAAAMIMRNPAQWVDAAKWLQTLPLCWAFVEPPYGEDVSEDEEKPRLIVDIDHKSFDSASPPPHEFDIYDDEPEAAKIQGPILRQLRNGWNAATFRFLHNDRDPLTRYIDFCMVDAQRLVLLAALTFNRDFDGAVLDLNWAWDLPSDSKATFEGRSSACVFISTDIAGKTLVEVISVAINYLQKMQPNSGGQVTYLATNQASSQVPELTESEEVIIKALSNAKQRAWSQFMQAEKELGNCTDKEAYNYVVENFLDVGEKIPVLSSWIRYLCEPRKLLGKNKNSPRSNRGFSASVVKSSDIEHKS